MDDSSFTIAKTAEAAHVGVETVRYYERRGLIAQPTQKRGAFRTYDRSHVARIRFIKRAQDLGFSLSEIEELLALQDGTARAEVRRIASARLAEIRQRIQDLERMERTLAALIERCRHGGRARCPIIEAIASDGRTGAAERMPARAYKRKRTSDPQGARRRYSRAEPRNAR